MPPAPPSSSRCREDAVDSILYLFWLVVSNIFYHFLFSIIYGIILPIDFHIFQRGSNHQPVLILLILGYLDPLIDRPTTYDMQIDTWICAKPIDPPEIWGIDWGYFRIEVPSWRKNRNRMIEWYNRHRHNSPNQQPHVICSRIYGDTTSKELSRNPTCPWSERSIPTKPQATSIASRPDVLQASNVRRQEGFHQGCCTLDCNDLWLMTFFREIAVMIFLWLQMNQESHWEYFWIVKPLVRGGHSLETGDGSTVLSNHHPTEQLGGRHGHYTIISPQKLGGTE